MRATNRGGNLTGGAGPEVEGGGEGDRKRVLMILRRLEDHGRVSGWYFAVLWCNVVGRESKTVRTTCGQIHHRHVEIEVADEHVRADFVEAFGVHGRAL